MKRITATKGHHSSTGIETLHIEAPGCIVNIRAGLVASTGEEVTVIEIKCDQIPGDAWTLADHDRSAGMSLRVVRDYEAVMRRP